MSFGRLRTHPAEQKKLLRYGFVGASLSFLYAGLTVLIAEATASTPLVASVSACLLSLPPAYLSHRYVTFRPTETSPGHIQRFVLAMTNAFVVSTVVMWLAVSVLRLHYGYALVATTVLVTAVNYAVLDAWVFHSKAPSTRR